MISDEQAAAFQARRTAFYAAHAATCEQLELSPVQLRHCRSVEISGRKITCAGLGFTTVPHIVEDRAAVRAKRESARLARQRLEVKTFLNVAGSSDVVEKHIQGEVRLKGCLT